MITSIKQLRNTAVGIALGSGGAKGLAHISVLECLDRLDVQVDMIAGTSIGAVIAVVYSLGRLREFRKEVENASWDEIAKLIDPAFFRSGIIDGKKIVEFLEKYIPSDIDLVQLPIPVAVVATDYESGNAVVFRKGNALAAVRASISIPGVFVPVKHDGRLLIDGNVANPLPISVLKKMGAGITIAVNLHPPAPAFNKKIRIGRPPKPKTLRAQRSLKSFSKKRVKFSDAAQRLLKTGSKTPSMIEVLTQTVEHLERQNTKRILSRDSPTVLIEPQVRNIGNLEFRKAKQALSEGHKACLQKKQELIRKVRRWSS